MKKILVVGGGSIGERHVRCFLATGRAEVGLCDISPDIRERLSERYSLLAAHPTLDEALQGDYQAVVICTPAHLHIPMALAVAKKELGLLIEKPLSTSLEGVDELAAVTTERQIPLSLAYVTRHHPALLEMKEALEQQRFGPIVELVVNSGQHFPFYRPAYREIYYNNHETGGGAIQDALTHMLNAAEWVAGPITSLVADAKHCVLPGVEVEDTVHVITRHDSVLGAFTLNQHQHANETTLTVVCQNGVMRLESTRGRWLSCCEPGAEWRVESTFELERDDLFVRQAESFLDQLDGKREAACTLQEGRQTLAVNLAALASVQKRCWIDL